MTGAYVVTSVDPHEFAVTADSSVDVIDLFVADAHIFTTMAQAVDTARTLAASESVPHYVCRLEAVGVYKPRVR